MSHDNEWIRNNAPINPATNRPYKGVQIQLIGRRDSDPNLADALWVLHECDNPPCVNPHHLFLGTVLDNNRDTLRKGRNCPQTGALHFSKRHPELVKNGIELPQSKLNETDVLAIRNAVKNGEFQRSIAARYEIAQSLVSLIVNRKIWKHIS